MAAAEQFVRRLEQKLATPEANIWGEKLVLIRGGVAFTRGQGSHVPVTVVDAFLVIGGVFQSDAHYKIIPSDTHKNHYEYEHRLSCYRLGPFTYRRVVEQRIRQAVDAIYQENTSKGMPSVSLTDTGDALQLTCLMNGYQVPDWVVRIIPGINGAGNPPGIKESGALSTWILVPPTKCQHWNQNLWEIARVPSALQQIQRNPELYRAYLCVLYEAERRQWSKTGSLDLSGVITSIAPSLSQLELRLPASVPEQTKNLLRELKDRLIAGYVAEYQYPSRNLLEGAAEDEMASVVGCIDRMLDREDLNGYVRQIESSIGSGQDEMAVERLEVSEAKYERRENCFDSNDQKSSLTKGSSKQLDESILELAESLNDYKQLAEESPIALERVNPTLTQSPIKEKNGVKKTTNGTAPMTNGTAALSNGKVKGFTNGRLPRSGESHPPRSIWRCVGALSLCLVALAVGVALLLTLLEETDLMKLMEMQLNKLSPDVSPDDKHEL